MSTEKYTRRRLLSQLRLSTLEDPTHRIHSNMPLNQTQI
jgi:hypothetical protein